VRPEESGRILRFALTLTLIPARFPSRSGGNLKEGGEIQQEPVARKRIKTAWRTATGNPTVSHALVRCAVRWARRKNASGRACAATKSAFTSGAKRPSDPTFSTSIAPRRACASKSTATTRSTLRRRPPTRPVPTAVGNPHPARPVGRTLRPSQCRRGVYRLPVSRADELAGTGVNPLLKVPPASRGNRTPVWFPSQAEGTSRRGDFMNCECAIRITLASRGTAPTGGSHSRRRRRRA
jgi:hypothetical protein